LHPLGLRVFLKSEKQKLNPTALWPQVDFFFFDFGRSPGNAMGRAQTYIPNGKLGEVLSGPQRSTGTTPAHVGWQDAKCDFF